MNRQKAEGGLLARIADSNLVQFLALVGSVGVLAIWLLVAIELLRRQEVLQTIIVLVLTPLLTPIIAWWVNTTLGAWAVGFACAAIVGLIFGRISEVFSRSRRVG